jgi:choline monooxygenase
MLNADIKKSSTPHADVYTRNDHFKLQQERLFSRTWHWVADEQDLKLENQVLPLKLLEGCLDEPLLLTRENGQMRCISNVCTHRGNLLIKHPAQLKSLVCRYHGRKFSLDGKFRHMPEFQEAECFPSACDDLPELRLENWNNLLFTSLDPAFPFSALMNEMNERIGWMPLKDFRYHPEFSQDYLVNANWALYCDNYLEGFHIPYVHESLNRMIDYQSYTTELFPWSVLQLGLAKGGEDSFDLPITAPDSGKKVAAYYFWVFPNMMFNFYPWGCSVNIVKPLGVSLTRVSFRTYIWKPEKFNVVAASMLERVEREDEDIVEQVQQGVQSRLYSRGRYSPSREQGVHHFHLLLDKMLK